MKNPTITELLSKLVEIPSISSLDENQKDVLDSANYIADLFKELGLNSKVTSSKNSKPAVLAHTEIDPSKQTVLLYAHHDVQPVGDIKNGKQIPLNQKLLKEDFLQEGQAITKQELSLIMKWLKIYLKPCL